MRAHVPDYDLQVAASLAEAFRLLEAGFRPFAGGTDLMVELASGALAHRHFVGIWNLPELRGIRESGDSVWIGAVATYSEIRRSPLLSAEFPLLVQAAAETGALATQNRGTLGGNIANASPAGDSCPPLLVYDAELELISPDGPRALAYSSFHLDYKRLDLRPNELIRGVRLPRGKAAWRQFYRKVGARRAQAISKVSLAAAAQVESGRIVDLRLVYGSVAPIPLRCFQTEGLLRGASLDALPDLRSLPLEISPIDDVRSTAAYRRLVARNLLRLFLESLV